MAGTEDPLVDEEINDPIPQPIQRDTERDGMSRTLVLVVLILGIEAVGLLFLARRLPANRSRSTSTKQAQTGTTASLTEVALGQVVVDNHSFPGASVQIEAAFCAVVASEDKRRCCRTIEQSQFRLLDTMATTLRQSDYHELEEPELRTIRRRLSKEVHRSFGADQLPIRSLIITKFKVVSQGGGVYSR